jgi:hypothetical protein
MIFTSRSTSRPFGLPEPTAICAGLLRLSGSSGQFRMISAGQIRTPVSSPPLRDGAGSIPPELLPARHRDLRRPPRPPSRWGYRSARNVPIAAASWSRRAS